MRSVRIALGLAFGIAVMGGDRALADSNPAQQSRGTGASCETIVYKSQVTDEQIEKARAYWHGDPKADDQEFLKNWLARHPDFVEGFVDLPDLSTHPLAGRPVQLQISAIDVLGQTGKSGWINCTLPEPGYINPINRQIAVIRGDMAKAADGDPAKIFYGQEMPQFSERFRALADADKNQVVTPETRAALENLVPEFDAARTKDQVDALFGKIRSVMKMLEDDHLSESAKAMRDAKKMLEDAYNKNREGIDEKTLKDFMKKAQKGVDQFLDEQIKEAQQKGDKDLEKKLRDMQKKWQDLQKALAQKDKKSFSNALDMYDLMREMMRAQEGRESLQDMMDGSQQMMQRMMQSMQNQMQEQQTLQGLQKMIQDQQNLLNDTGKTEAERQEMMDKLRHVLDKQTQDMQDRAKAAQDSAEADAQKQKADNDAADKASNAEQAKAMEELGQRLNDAIDQRAQNPNLPPDQAKRLSDAKVALDRDLEKLKKPEALKQQDLDRIQKDLERASSELDRMTDPSQAVPSESFGKDTDKLGRAIDSAKAQKQDRDDKLKQMQEGAQDLKSIQDDLQNLHGPLQDPKLDRQGLLDSAKKLGDLGKRLAKRQKADMPSLLKMIMALTGQLDDRVDEAGAYAYRVETAARLAGDADAIKLADARAADQERAVALGNDIATIRQDAATRLEKEAPPTEDQARAIIARLKDIKAALDQIDPRPQRAQNNNNQNGDSGGNQQQQTSPDELEQELMRLFQQQNQDSQQQQQMQQQLQQMLQQNQGLGGQQQQLEQQLEQMRQQMEKAGVPKEDIDNTIQQMRDAAEKLQQGQPGGSMPKQNQSLQQMMKMQGQMQQPGIGQGEGSGWGTNGSTGHSLLQPHLHDMSGGGPVTDLDKTGNAIRDIQDKIRNQIGKNPPPDARDYLQKLQNANGPH